MSGASSRRKGADFERALVHRFREAMPEALIRRGLQYRTGQEVSDVEVPCFWLEAKAHQRTNVREALRQALETCPAGRWLCARTTGSRPSSPCRWTTSSSWCASGGRPAPGE
ncbi:hypothetical protein [Corallococcus exiguus]|uniref:hypothetical protein n=1 Tax=Corallococcus exiguus TaxID=83462 RepID=UPI00201639BF|nr:hypothetical protein [Corallococcus exiguus]